MPMSWLVTMQMSWLLTMQMSWLLTMQMSWLQTQQMSWLQTSMRLAKTMVANTVADGPGNFSRVALGTLHKEHSLSFV